jgi:hypothetical protein
MLHLPPSAVSLVGDVRFWRHRLSHLCDYRSHGIQFWRPTGAAAVLAGSRVIPVVCRREWSAVSYHPLLAQTPAWLQVPWPSQPQVGRGPRGQCVVHAIMPHSSQPPRSSSSASDPMAKAEHRNHGMPRSRTQSLTAEPTATCTRWRPTSLLPTSPVTRSGPRALSIATPLINNYARAASWRVPERADLRWSLERVGDPRRPRWLIGPAAAPGRASLPWPVPVCAAKVERVQNHRPRPLDARMRSGADLNMFKSAPEEGIP